MCHGCCTQLAPTGPGAKDISTLARVANEGYRGSPHAYPITLARSIAKALKSRLSVRLWAGLPQHRGPSPWAARRNLCPVDAGQPSEVG